MIPWLIQITITRTISSINVKMSATDHMRAMLDGLMGTARDGTESQRQHLHFTDSRVCRPFLLDCCPHDIFASTKLELGECAKVHDPALRADYIMANKQEDYMYEVSAMDKLQMFVNDADRKTELLKRKLAETQEEITSEEANKLNRIHELNETLGKKLAQKDKAIADGEEPEAINKLDAELDKIKSDRSLAEVEYKRISKPASSHQQQNLRVCDICSAYLGVNDNDARLTEHFGGKLHLGFVTVREKLEDLKKIVAEKRGSAQGRRGSDKSSTSNNNVSGQKPSSRGPRERHADRDYGYEYDRMPMRGGDYDRDYDREYRGRSREYDYYRDYERDRYRERDRDRMRDSRYSRDGERDRGRASNRYYRDREDSRDLRGPPRDRYRDDRMAYDRGDRMPQIDRDDRSERHGSISSRTGDLSSDGRRYGSKDGESAYQRRLRQFEKLAAERAHKNQMRLRDEQDTKRLKEQEAKKLKEFLEDYKDDRDDARFFRGTAFSRRLADRRKEFELDDLNRQKEKQKIELISRECAIDNSKFQPIECTQITDKNNHAINPSTNDVSNGDNAIISSANKQSESETSVEHTRETSNPASKGEIIDLNSSSSTTAKSSTKNPGSSQAPSKGLSAGERYKQVEALIGKIPTDKEQLFARELDWSLLDENLMEKRIRPWVTKKIAEYMGEQEVDLIDFVCTLLNAHTDGSSMLREVAIVLDDEAEKFVVHMWRLLIFELEAKKTGLRK